MSMSKEIVGEEPVVSSEGQESVGRGRAKTLQGRVFAGFLFFLLISPVVYGIANILFSPIFNRAFNYPQECTIVGGAKGVSRSKSSSGNYYIYVETTDCPDMRYQGVRNGLTLEEVADRIDLLEGQKVTVDVGYWQLPLSDTEIVGIEGLDLSK